MAAPVVTCTCQVCSRARTKIRRIFGVLDTYGWLLDSYIVRRELLYRNRGAIRGFQDFFQERLWEKLPYSWRLVLQAMSPDEFGKWLAGDISCTRVWPLSLLALRQAAKCLQIDRDYQNHESTIRCGRAKRASDWCNSGKSITKVKDKESQTKDLLHVTARKHNNLFVKHVKIKKRHEIERMAQVCNLNSLITETTICADCALESGAESVVDVGAGMGHLARFLAFKYGLCVTCVEQDASLSQRARKWDRELLLSMAKHLPDLPINLPRHVSAKVENRFDFEVEEMQQIFSSNFNLSEEERTAGFGIAGLHPCGDLAATLLRLYVARREARFISIVGCCYMKLTLEHPTGALSGYPLSKYLSSFGHCELSYTALEVACHAIESYCDKLRTGNYEDLMVHAYRAALETVLIRRSEQLRRIQVRSVKATKYTTFQQYCVAATADLEPHLRPDDSDLQDTRVKCLLSRWWQVVIFGALRTMLAPLVETVVLLDRFLFLSENNLSPTLRPIFDARLSPRNFLLFSVKDGERPAS